MSAVQKFYNQIQFPGHYSLESIELQSQHLTNRYLKLIDRYLDNHQTVLDVGCGSGVITNVFAKRYPMSQFIGLDFADSIEYASKMSVGNTNSTFVKQNFLEFDAGQQFDRVICQGVLHHIPNADLAVKKLKNLVAPGGKLLLGLYHPWGKICKKIINIDYKHQVLYQDQELNPYETSYTAQQVKQLFANFDFVDACPYALNMFIALPSLFNYRNGGLVTYVLEKKS
jgi:ubiquinone/menaquinone biosynthesis C-methylase UbiE